MRRTTLGTLGIAALVAVTTAMAGELTAKERAAARKLYVAKCAKGHRFYEPTNYTQVDWQRWMESMSRKSRLKPSQRELLMRYLDAYRAGQLPQPPEAPVKSAPDRPARRGSPDPFTL